MPALRVTAGALVAAALVACHPRSTATPDAPPPHASAEPEAEPPSLVIPAPEPYRLSEDPEDEVPPLTAVEPEEYRTPVTGPRYLYGRAAPRRGRPNAPGRHGELLVAIDTPYQLFGRSASYAHVVAWRRNGTPAAGARVFHDRRPVGRTDRNGTLVFRYEQPPPAKGEDEWGFGENSLFVIDGGKRCGAVGFDPYERTKTFATDRLFVYTDRGVFQPGETVHVRTIGWQLRHDYTPLAGAAVEFLLRDATGHSVAAAAGTTDEFGVTSVDLGVPLTATSGNYQLRVDYGDERATTMVQVRHFEPPQLGLEHSLGRFLLSTRTTDLPLHVTLHPPGGRNAGRSTVQVVARDSDDDLVVSLEREVKGNGPHHFTLAAKDVRQIIERSDLGKSVSVTLTAKDEHGRTTKTIQPMELTDNPFEAVLELDRDYYTTGDPAVVVAKVRDLAGVPLRNEEIRLHRQGKTTVLATATTDDAGMAQFSLTMPAKSAVVELRRPGQAKALSSVELPWTDPVPMRTEVGSTVIKEREPTTVRVHFPTGHRPTERFVHMDITDTSGAIVGSKLLPIRTVKGKAVATGEFIAPSWGSMLLTFFALGEHTGHSGRELGLMVGGQSLVVQTDRELEVTLTGMPARARPGQPLEVTAHVVDPAGRPAEVSLGAALVDKNVLRMRDPLLTTPMDRFYDPLLRTMATTGAKMLTWPVVSRNWGEDYTHDIALPPFNWTEGGPVGSCRDHWDAQDYEAAGEGTFGMGGMGLIGKGGGGGVGRRRTRSRSRITIRKRFPATSLWEPHLRGTGEVRIRGQLPDQIGEQELVVVASDKHGGVGLARGTVQVDQTIYAEAQLPERSIVGEVLKVPVVVHNGTGKAQRFDVKTTFGRSTQNAEITVPAGADRSTAVPLRLRTRGTKTLTVTTTPHGGTPADAVAREVHVSPPGVALPGRTSAVVRGRTTLRVVVPPGQRAQAHLRVELPAVTHGFLQLDDVLATVSDEPWSLVGDLTTAVLVLELAQRHKIRSPEIDRLREGYLAATAILGRVQGPDGGFAYWRNGEASPYITAKILAGMVEARRVGLPVHDEVIRHASRYLAKHLRKGIPVSVAAIGWWEGSTNAVRDGLTAEIFDVVTRVPKELRGPRAEAQLTRLSTEYARDLQRTRLDAQTAGHALSGLLRLQAIDSADARDVAQRLLAARDRDHWEPTWFHAYGGRVDATLAVLQALQLADPAGSQVDKRDALSWILATRPSWGDWHNDAGTAAALRALSLVGAPAEAKPATLVVRKGRATLRRLTVDPDDPLGSTLAAQHIDLGDDLGPGTHEVTVEYDGTLEPVATVVTRTFTPGKTGPQTGGGLTLKAAAPDTVKADSTLVLRIDAEGERLGGSTLLLSATGLLEPDLGALARSIGRGGPIAAIRPTALGLELSVSPDVDEVGVTVPLLAVREGTGRLPAVALVPPAGRGKAKPLVVDPGALTVTEP